LEVGIDILENEIVTQYPNLLETLLCDRTTKNNIFWATDNYEHLGKNYAFYSPILPEYITGENGSVIMPRIYKDKILQQNRSKEMAEVFTPSWFCNAQNNLIDNIWFGKEGIFNIECIVEYNDYRWITNMDEISFPEGKSWQDYVKDTRLEVSCGEAPYITSRYDSTTGEYMPVNNRVGILDRKMRVINENVDSPREWIKAAEVAYKNTYAFEWQGDSLLLAREAMLVTFIENYYFKFAEEPSLKSIQSIGEIISWNVWQMDGIKGVIPNSCGFERKESINLFGEVEINQSFCLGCEKGDIEKHNGVYCLVKDWFHEINNGKNSVEIRFIDLLNNHGR